MKNLIMKVVPVIVAVAGWITAFVQKNKEELAALVKRVEKDTSDGKWTAEEKRYLAEKIFREKIYPKMPIYIKIFGVKLVTKWAMKIIEKICKKAKLLE